MFICCCDAAPTCCAVICCSRCWPVCPYSVLLSYCLLFFILCFYAAATGSVLELIFFVPLLTVLDIVLAGGKHFECLRSSCIFGKMVFLVEWCTPPRPPPARADPSSLNPLLYLSLSRCLASAVVLRVSFWRRATNDDDDNDDGDVFHGDGGFLGGKHATTKCIKTCSTLPYFRRR